MELAIENALNIGADEFYRSSRYDLPLIVVLINSKNKKAFDILEGNIRQTDIIQQMSSNSIIIFLAHTNLDEANLFLSKVKSEFDFTYSLKEFSGNQDEFLKSLFLENMRLLKILI